MFSNTTEICSAYISLPIIEALEKLEIFSKFDDVTFKSASFLAKKIQVEPSSLLLCFDILHACGMVDKNARGSYRLKSVDFELEASCDLLPLYWLAHPAQSSAVIDVAIVQASMKELLQRVRSRSFDATKLPFLALAVLLNRIKSLASNADVELQSGQAELQLCCIELGKCIGVNEKLSDALVDAMAQIDASDIMPNLLSVLASLQSGSDDDSHASTLMPIRSVRSVMQRLSSVFNATPLLNQPSALLCSGMNRSAIREILAYIQNETLRGRQCNEFPLTLLFDEDHRQRHRLAGKSLLMSYKLDDNRLSPSKMIPLSLNALLNQSRDSDWLFLSACFPGIGVDGNNAVIREIANLLAIHATSGRDAASRLLMDCAGVGRIGDSGSMSIVEDEPGIRYHLFELRSNDFTIRAAKMADIEPLKRLETLCWPHSRSSESRIRARIAHYPEGQYVLEKQGHILGVLYTQRIASIDAIFQHTTASVHELHQHEGRIAQLLAINVDPVVQDLGLGDRLLEFALQHTTENAQVDQVVGVTLCRKFHADFGITFDEYIRRAGLQQDPVLAFHVDHGAEVISSVPNYRPEDDLNRHNGVLVSYSLETRLTKRLEKVLALSEDIIGSDQQWLNSLRNIVASLLGCEPELIDDSRPFMESGLDSADLLKLQRELERTMHTKLGIGVFFTHNTVAKLSEFLQDRSKPASPTTTSLPIHAEQNDAARLSASDTDIAILGMSCKLPAGIECPAQLWNILIEGRSVIGTYPRERGWWPSDVEKPYLEFGGFMSGADEFDAEFFRIPPVEALSMDPQQRILLQLVWKCMEDAGVQPSSVKGSATGVFVGASNNDYGRLASDLAVETKAHAATGNSLAVLANRISYFFDWNGPSLLIDTACSASMHAVHSAVQSLRHGECKTAIVAGVNLICHPELSNAYGSAGMLAKDGLCKVFDAKADGYVRSEGAVVLLLKPLRQAIADKDNIRAVIKGSAINHGGLASGLTVPNPKVQSDLIQSAWLDANISPADISYFEAHGTGTSLGDPIEIEGVSNAFKAQKVEAIESCGIGSIKSNVGHLEPAAGIAGILKVVLAMEHQKLPASINFSRLNPKISLEKSPLFVVKESRTWESSKPLLASVSSFGSGGANAHVVLQSWKNSASRSGPRCAPVFVLSARSRERLKNYAATVLEFLQSHGESDAAWFADFLYTFQLGRQGMRERLAIVANDIAELNQRLSAWLAGAKTNELTFCEAAAQGSVQRIADYDSYDWSRPQIAAMAAARMWCEGSVINFAQFSSGDIRRISAPGYPFSKAHYWLSKPASMVAHQTMLGQSSRVREETQFRKDWARMPAHYLFQQEGFCCVSIGYLFEAMESVTFALASEKHLLSIHDLRVTPRQINAEASATSIVRCRTIGDDIEIRLYIRQSSIDYLCCSARLQIADEKRSISRCDNDAIGAQVWHVDESAVSALPMQALNATLPLLLAPNSSSISIRRVDFFDRTSRSDKTVLIHHDSVVTVATDKMTPILALYK